MTHRVPEMGRKRKFSIPAEIIDITGQDTGDDETVVNAKCFRADHRQLLTSVLKKGVMISELVDCHQSYKGKGRKAKDEILRLSISCIDPKTLKPYWRCIALGCDHFQAGNRQLSRILVHAMDCPRLSSELKDLANDTAIVQNAPGAKVNPRQIQVDTEDPGPSYKKAKTIQNTLTDVVITTGKIKYEDEVNLRIVEFIAVSAIPAIALDSPQWKRFMQAVSKSKYNSPSSSTLTEKLIPGQAALV